jgi:alcohol dehydrogenase class IV
LGAALESLGIKRPLIMTDPGLVAAGVLAKVNAAIPNSIERAIFDQTPENPTDAGVEAAHEVYKESGCDGIIALGGGSVIDAAKATAVLAGHPPPVRQYCDDHSKITAATAPIVAVPTTAGTGSEVTRGAGIHPTPETRGWGMNGHHLLPRIAICDPELTLTLPPFLTAATGMDALSHCLEGYLSPAVNPPVEAIALDGMRRVAQYIDRATDDGSDREARWHMLMAALEGGMSISKGLGAVHSLAITFGDTGLHHGALVTISMPAVVRFSEDAVGEKLAKVHEALGLPAGLDVATGIEKMNERLGLPASLKDMDYTKTDIDEMAETATAIWFNATAPKRPETADFRDMIVRIMG